MQLNFSRSFGLVLLVSLLAGASSAEAKCFVAKRKFIAVDLTDDRSSANGMMVIEYVHVYPGSATLPSTFRLSGASGAWKIPTLCMAEMQAKLTKPEIELVLQAIPKQ